MTYSRPVSSVERAWLAADRLCPPFAIAVVAEGRGALEPSAWRAAVDAAVAVVPGARVVLRGLLCGARWTEGGVSPPVRVVEDAWDGRREVPWLARPLDVVRGPVAEVVLAPGPVARVVVRVHHAVMDGRGALVFARAIGQALRGEAVTGARAVGTDLQVAAGQPRGRLPEPTSVALTGAHDGSPLAVRWRRATVRGRQSSFLPRVVAAVAAHARRGDARAPVCVHVPVDLRSPDAPPSTANLTGMALLTLPAAVQPDQVSEALSASIAAGGPAGWVQATAWLRHLPLAWIEAGGRSSAERSNAEGRYGATATVSNLGSVPVDLLDGAGFRAETVFVVPPSGISTAALLTATRAGDRTELVLSMPEGLASDGRLDAALEAVVGALEAGR